MSLCEGDDNIQVVLETVDYIWDDHLTRFVILEEESWWLALQRALQNHWLNKQVLQILIVICACSFFKLKNKQQNQEK